MKLEGKVAIVTGSSQGIGSGIALKFAEEGADVVVNYLKNDDKAETVARRIQVYLEQTASLISYYRECCMLVEIDGAQPIEQVTDALVKAFREVVLE